MRYYDVTQEVFHSAVYPGDPAPEYERISEIVKGDICNLTYLKMCAHNGTHMDAPRHFADHGRGIDEIALEEMIGECYVIDLNGELDGESVRLLAAGRGEKILLKGPVILTESSAEALKDMGVRLLGVESQTVGTEETAARVHHILLGADMVLLEGLDLNEIEEGAYQLYALPLKLRGCDGAPCRVILGK